VVPFVVLLAMLAVRPWGLFGHARGTRSRMSGYFRVRYSEDFALLDTRVQKVWFAVFFP